MPAPPMYTYEDVLMGVLSGASMVLWAMVDHLPLFLVSAGFMVVAFIPRKVYPRHL